MKFAKILATLLTQSSNEFTCLHVLGKPTIVFSGTQTWRDLLYDDFDVHPVLWPDKDGHYVHGGFARMISAHTRGQTATRPRVARTSFHFHV